MSNSNLNPETLNTSAPKDMTLSNWVLFRLSNQTDSILADICGVVRPSDLTPEALENGYYIARGVVNNSPKVEPGSIVFTSRIKKCDDNQLCTKSGSHYTLLDMNPDFLEFAEAAAKYPVLENWGIGTATISEDSTVPNGVFIKGNIRGKEEEIIELITAQESSVITCHDGKKYCIDWCAVNCFQNYLLQTLASPNAKQHDKITPIFTTSAYDPEQQRTLSYDISRRVKFLDIKWDYSYTSEPHIHFSKAKELWNLEGNT